jgi:tetratricopeptide (TPR) repeat protein
MIGWFRIVLLGALAAPLAVLADDAVSGKPAGDAAGNATVLERARDFYESGKEAEAVSILSGILKENPDDGKAMELLIKAIDAMGQMEKDADKAGKLFRKAVDLARGMAKKHPDEPMWRFLLAKTLGHLSLTLSGKEKLETGREVERDAKKAIELDSKFAPPYAVLGVYYREVASMGWFTRKLADSLFGGLKGTLAMSEKALRKAVELDPDAIYAHYELAVTLEKEGRSAEAAKHYAKILSLPRRDPMDAGKQAVAKEKLKKLSK